MTTQPTTADASRTGSSHCSGKVAIVCGDPVASDRLAGLVAQQGWPAVQFARAEALLAAAPEEIQCLLVEIDTSGWSEPVFQDRLRSMGIIAPVIALCTALGPAPAASALELGACGLFETNGDAAPLVQAIARAIERGRPQAALRKWRARIIARMATLTCDERQVMELMVSDTPNKTIAARLDVSPRTVDRLRHAVLMKMEADSVPQLAMLVAELLEEARSRC